MHGGSTPCTAGPKSASHAPPVSLLCPFPRGRWLKNGRRRKVPNWYLDLSMIIDYWGKNRVYHHTAPVNMLYALYQALQTIFAEGLDAVFTRHRRTHAMLVRGFGELGLKMVVEEPFRLPMLNTVYCPAGIDEAAVRRGLRSEHRIEIGGGLGPLTGKIWRIGLMGHTAAEENVRRFLDALRTVI
ncbi:MAG TPA: hypothetical protein PLU95_08395 [Syntrophales bacterium]|nr:hypothetical protein [Syntrophales bacterium]